MSLIERIDKTIRDVEDFPKKGIVFKDITPILKNATLSADIVNELSNNISSQVTHVAGIESRGFLFGFPTCIQKGISFVLVRKKGKLPYKTVSLEYDLEYGSAEIEMHIDSVGPGDKVIIHDDLLATGGTVNAASKLVEKAGGQLVGCAFIIELSALGGRKNIPNVPINSLIEYD